MKYRFYQRIIPINHLIYVGEVAVPDDRDRWHFTAQAQVKLHFTMEQDTTPDFVVRRENTYIRKRMVTGDIFVADVTPIED